MDFIELNRRYLTDYAKRFYGLDSIDKHNYKCINANNHKNGDKNPSMVYYADTNKYYCFSCGESYDLKDLAEIQTGIKDPKELLKYLLEYYNEGNDYKPMQEIKQVKQVENNVKINIIDINKKNLTEYFRKQYYEKDNTKAKEYFKTRGLSEDIQERYLLSYGRYYTDVIENDNELKGIHNAYDNFKGVYYIPYINYKGFITYFMSGLEHRLEQPRKVKYLKPKQPIKTELFNERYIMNEEEIIFITEGEIDALSIEDQNEKYKALALGGIGQTRLEDLIEYKKEQIKRTCFILATDNDESGQKAREDLKKILDKHKLIYVDYWEDVVKKNDNLEKIAGSTKDVNEQLTKDKTLFMDALETSYNLTMEKKYEEQDKLEDEKKERLNKKLATYYLPSFIDNLTSNKYKTISSGSKELDKALEGGFFKQSTNYILGAPSVGKTTYALNLVENFLQDNYVMYFSLEMSKDQIISKIISRNTINNMDAMRHNLKLSSNEILRNYNDPIINGIVKDTTIKLEDKLNHLIIETFTSQELATEENIIKRVEDVKEIIGQTPIIFIDYIQLLDAEDNTDEYNLLKRVTRQLKDYAIDNDTMIFLLTASNRNSNKEGKVDMYSGRGSSSLEYGGDVVISINFTDVVIPDYKPYKDRNKQTKYKKVEYDETKLKAEDPRRVTITIEKNRYGKVGEMVHYYFNARQNDFKVTPNNKPYNRFKKLKDTYNNYNEEDIEDVQNI